MSQWIRSVTENLLHLGHTANTNDSLSAHERKRYQKHEDTKYTQ